MKIPNIIRSSLLFLIAYTTIACSDRPEVHYYSADLSTRIILKGDDTARIISGDSIVEAEYTQTDTEVHFTAPGQPKNILTKKDNTLVGIPRTPLYLPQYIDETYQSVAGRKLKFMSNGNVEDSAHEDQAPLKYFKIDDNLYIFKAEPNNSNAFRQKQETLISRQGESFFQPQWTNKQFRSIGGLTMAFDDKGAFKFIQANKEVAGTGEYVLLGNTLIIKTQIDGKDQETQVIVKKNQIITPDGITYKEVTL